MGTRDNPNQVDTYMIFTACLQGESCQRVLIVKATQRLLIAKAGFRRGLLRGCSRRGQYRLPIRDEVGLLLVAIVSVSLEVRENHQIVDCVYLLV